MYLLFTRKNAFDESSTEYRKHTNNGSATKSPKLIQLRTHLFVFIFLDFFSCSFLIEIDSF